MPGFADSFWSGDYAGGLGVLFSKLQQGIVENQQVLTMARLRAEAEEAYGRRLGDIAPTAERMGGGFSRDDGASLRKAYEGVRTEMQEAAKSHHKIASNISELVVIPFSRWSSAHEARVQNSQDDLQTRIKAHDRQAEIVRKLRSSYFNKCRQVEDLEEENKLAFQDPEKTEPLSPKIKPTPSIALPESDPEDEEPIEIGDITYQPDQVKQILTHMLNNIKLGEAKVPIIGTYQNTSTGSDIVEYLQKHMGASSVSYAERIGQDLVSNGFLRLVGSVGSIFANSSRMNYQWRPKVFQITGIPEKKKPLDRVSSIGSTLENTDSPIVGSMGEMLQGWNPLNNPYPNETPAEKLRRESSEADEKYKAGVRRLDSLRCSLEEAMIDHLKFMEKCELDRLKAIKAVILDFSGAISNAIPSLQSTVDNMMLYQETVQPLADLRYLLESYRTGSFVPRVQVYDNYYNNVDEQTFGVDLEARARADRKRVPTIVTTILTFLDNHYPDLEGDEARRGIWLVDVPLAATHHLRNSINTGKAIPREILERYEIPIVASALKLYLLELPDSLVSSQVYEIIKTIYSTPDSSSPPQTRISVLQNTLGQLRLANIATLDAVTTHFTRLIELTSADETYVTSLAQTLAPCILRPRTESSLTMNERHSYRLIRDLFDHKEEIFGELKRASTMHHQQTERESAHARQVKDEHNRRANMEARNRAIASRSRASSPAPPSAAERANGRSQRHDRASSTAETRFPIQTSPTNGLERRSFRQSLEVPGESALESPTVSSDNSSKHTPTAHLPPPSSTNTTATETVPVPDKSSLPDEPSANGISEHAVPASLAQKSVDSTGEDGLEKKNSFGRSAGVGRFARRAGTGASLPGARNSAGSFKRDSLVQEGGRESEEGEKTHGVQLSDRPMDD